MQEAKEVIKEIVEDIRDFKKKNCVEMEKDVEKLLLFSDKRFINLMHKQMKKK